MQRPGHRPPRGRGSTRARTCESFVNDLYGAVRLHDALDDHAGIDVSHRDKAACDSGLERRAVSHDGQTVVFNNDLDGGPSRDGPGILHRIYRYWLTRQK